MHMADALISPAVGGTMWAASASLIALSSKKVKGSLEDRVVPLMGVLGAFVFAAQMINFTIPGTGSSGHIGGGMILSILLGPYAAFLTIGSVLFVQALFFADGGLLALGCNIFNLGFFPAMTAYPLVYRPIAGSRPTRRRIILGSTLSAVVALQLGALGVVVQTALSGVADLSFSSFLLLMQPIHLAIGFMEGLVTAAVVLFIRKARPEILAGKTRGPAGGASLRPVWTGFALAAVLLAGFFAWFASAHPDGLEWAVSSLTGKERLESPSRGIHHLLETIQEKTAVLPDYGFKAGEEKPPEEESWPVVDAGTSMSGLLGGAITLATAFLIALPLRRRRRKGVTGSQP
jgi:cobalt/nickel transport system permease protein